jgi:L-gulonate 3-dehydrogenase
MHGITKAAVIGSGFIGRAWAIVFARAGLDVTLWDKDFSVTQAAIGYIEDVAGDLAANDLLNEQSPDALIDRLLPVRELSVALDGAGYIQENTPEDIKIKRAILGEIDGLARPEAVIASSTSALLPSQLSEKLAGRERFVVAHPINPPYLIPAVEIVPAQWTSKETIHQTAAFMRGCGQAPIVMDRELDGFIMNRMQGALLEEAFRLVAEGYASVEDIDIGIREGLALRWSFMGPFETIDLNAPGGVADYVARYQPIYENIFKQTSHRVDWAGDVLKTVEHDRRNHLAEKDLAGRQQWRDRRLMALAAHKRQSNKEFGK